MQSNPSNRSIYPFPPIGSRIALARMFQCSVGELSHIELISDDLYREVRQTKKDGSYRTCYDAKFPLKSMQARIQCMILKRVRYASYLMGGVADEDQPRDYVRNATVHAGARVMVNEDVSAFFQSTSERVVFDIWKYVFHFSPDVARSLTRLTTRAGQLPQGAKTSSYLANLVFWALEPDLVNKLRTLGFEYTRYIDDMTISSKHDQTPEHLGLALSLVAAMVRRYGLRFKRSKHRIIYAGQRMQVTGLVVGQDSAGLAAKKKSNIRALVHGFELDSRAGHGDDAVRRRVASLVGQYARLHPRKGEALKSRLSGIPA